MTTHAVWPMCQRCSLWTTRAGRWSKHFAIIPAAILAALSLLAAIFLSRPGSFVSPVAMLLLLASFLVAVFGCFFATVIHWFATRPDSCISNFPTVKPIRGGKAMFSRRTFVVLEFLNPLYVEALLAQNDQDNFKWQPRALEKAKVSFHKWSQKQKNTANVAR